MTYKIETSRFYLREFHISDAPGLNSLNDAPDVLYLTGDPPFEDISMRKILFADTIIIKNMVLIMKRPKQSSRK
ncbi:MAG: hypothetical protein SCALA702_23480 [Melioribacteraceae bacterium]|nr:MAG: hypothetical protein SCALA702_23480 [Melioribacteraceae bacterium]